jgi:hypothetical protein
VVTNAGGVLRYDAEPAELIDDRFVRERSTRPLFIAEACDQFDRERLAIQFTKVANGRPPLLLIEMSGAGHAASRL